MGSLARVKTALQKSPGYGALQALLGFNAISLLHVAHPKEFAAACHGAFDAARRQATRGALEQIPEVRLGDILGDRKPIIRQAVMRSEDGMLSNDQITALLSILVSEQPREVLEIGTFMGYTTRQMAENLDHSIVHTVDLPQDFAADTDPNRDLPKDDYHLIARRVVGREYRDRPCAARIRQHFADTATWDFSEAGHPTFFFIDGSHTYEYCRNDSEKCYALCNGRGVFLWHDCDEAHPDVIRFILEWRSLGRDIRRIAGTPICYWKSS